MIAPLRRRLARALDRRAEPLARGIERLEAALREQDARIAELAERSAAADMSTAALLHSLAADDPGNRRRLEALRADTGYDAAWEDPDPLVTISIPTWNRPGLLAERSLRSALAQSHERIEVLVVGDAAGPEVAAVVEAAGDPRARFVNLTHRWIQGGDRHWLTATTLARNEAYRLARGRWLVDLDDDDALRPDAVERLLADARERGLEVVHGDLEQHAPGGSTERIGGFPPALGQFGWQGAIVHSGLRFFAREHIAADLGLPGDWFRAERMLRAGVRFGRLERATCDYYPSKLWSAGG
jgi:glycosyltransferase involved in cell wall biosynthesis